MYQVITWQYLTIVKGGKENTTTEDANAETPFFPHIVKVRKEGV